MDFSIIIRSQLINKSELARLLWPDKKGVNVRFSNKLNEKEGQRFTDAEKARIVEIVKTNLKI